MGFDQRIQSGLWRRQRFHHLPGRLRQLAARLRRRFRTDRQCQAARQLQPYHHPARLCLDAGRPDARPAVPHRRRHRRARQSGPAALQVQEYRPVGRMVLCPGQLPVGRLLRQAGQQFHFQHAGRYRRLRPHQPGRRSTLSGGGRCAGRRRQHDGDPQLYLRQLSLIGGNPELRPCDGQLYRQDTGPPRG